MIWLRSLLFVCVSLAAMLPAAIVFLPCLAFARRVAATVPARFAGLQLALLRRLAGLELEVRGLERMPAGPALIAVKHQSALETYALAGLFPGACFVVKRELVRIPVIGWFIAAMGVLAIDRKRGPAALRKLIAGARKAVADGRHVVIFPEGTRTAPNARQPYHSGVAGLYGALDMPVVPVALNTGLFWPPRRVRKRPGRAVMAFLEPLPPGLPRRRFMTALEDRIETGSDRLAREATCPARPWRTASGLIVQKGNGKVPPCPKDGATR